MCSASRALVVTSFAATISGVAWAQAPAIPSTQPLPEAPPAAAPNPPSPAPSAPPPAPAPEPAFTAAPAPVFTPPPPVWAPAYVYPVPPPAPPPAVEKPPRDVRVASAHADRVVFLPTAETHPSGTWFVTDYEIIIPQVGVAVSDRTQISLALTGDPGAKDPIGFGDFSVKSVLGRGRRYRLAAMGSVSGLLGFEQGFGLLGRAGFVTELCFDDTCRSSANVAINMGFLGSALLMLDGVGFVFNATTALSVLVEGQTVVPVGEGAEEAHGVGGALGLRLARERWGLDFAVEGFTRGRGEKKLPAIPILVFTYRFLP